MGSVGLLKKCSKSVQKRAELMDMTKHQMSTTNTLYGYFAAKLFLLWILHVIRFLNCEICTDFK